MSDLATIFKLYSGTKHRGRVPMSISKETISEESFDSNGYSLLLSRIGRFKSTETIQREIWFDGKFITLVERKVTKINNEAES